MNEGDSNRDNAFPRCQAKVPVFDGEFNRNARLIAASIVQGNGRRQDARDFVDDAPAILYERVHKYDPQNSGPTGFWGWAHIVLTNAWIDRYRRQKKGLNILLNGDLLTLCATEDTELASADFRSGLATPFSPADLATIRRWTALQTVVLLTVAGLWKKLAAFAETSALWQEKLCQCGVSQFPDRKLTDCSSPEERLHLIAETMGSSGETVTRQWARCQTMLLNLEFVRHLLPDEQHSLMRDVKKTE